MAPGTARSQPAVSSVHGIFHIICENSNSPLSVNTIESLILVERNARFNIPIIDIMINIPGGGGGGTHERTWKIVVPLRG